jgi:hypothetical protein
MTTAPAPTHPSVNGTTNAQRAAAAAGLPDRPIDHRPPADPGPGRKATAAAPQPETPPAPPIQAVTVTRPPEPPRERIVVVDAIPTMDTGRFEHMQRLATMMAQCSLVPEHLRKGDRGEAIANCFLVTNQAIRWGMDPFSVAQCTSVVSGKLCYEGKLVAAVLAAKLGIRLRYTWTGERGTMTRGIIVSGDIDGETLTIEGTVADWKTTRNGSPWIVPQYDKMLAYRGAREWARLYAPDVMLGVYAPDEEFDDRRPMRDVTPRRGWVQPNPDQPLKDPDIDLSDDTDPVDHVTRLEPAAETQETADAAP